MPYSYELLHMRLQRPPREIALPVSPLGPVDLHASSRPAEQLDACVQHSTMEYDRPHHCTVTMTLPVSDNDVVL